MTTFSDLNLCPPLQQAIEKAGYTTPTPIQAQAIPVVMAEQDVLGCAQTGTGKTAAFLLPMLHRLHNAPKSKHIKTLILTPTRELAAQIGENFATYAQFTNLKHLVIFGGVKQGSQVKALKRGVDVLVATPGRLLDLHGQGFVSLDQTEFFVLDEADRMLDMGFLPDIKRLLKLLPTQRQNLLFSATMPKDIVQLASQFLTDPVRVEVDRESSTVEQIEQLVMFVEQSNKKHLLKSLLDSEQIEATIVFTRTKHGANRVVKYLEKGGISAAAIHGNKSQNARTRALDGFREGSIKVLVATDIASRGIDVDRVSHVFNFDIPNIPESYVHRIGRTGRAGSTGQAIAFCSPDEADYLVDIEKIIGKEVPDNREHEWHFYPALERVLVVREEEKRNKGSRPKASKKGKKPTFRRQRNDRNDRNNRNNRNDDGPDHSGNRRRRRR
jgi:ATP-dependent RNA helicase RhlE